MNIAYVLSDFPVFSETFVGDEMRAMEARGHKIFPIALRERTDRGQDDDAELAARAIRLPSIGWPAAAGAVVRAGIGAMRAKDFVLEQSLLPRPSLLANALKIAAVAKRHRCQHIHAHFAGGAAAHAIVAARIMHATVSFICHGHDVYSEPEDLPAKLNAADFVIATCEDMARDLRAMAPAASIQLSYCGIDPAKLEFRGIAHNNGKLLFIGRLVPQKGVDDILEALALLPPDERPALDIAGNGPWREQLERLRNDKGLDGSVTFLGAVPRSWFVHGGADYLALVAPFKTGPHGERDSGPTVVKEAMAIGLPVIATRYMGVKEFLVPGTGLPIAPSDVVALTRAIQTIRSMADGDRRALTARARSHVLSHFTLEKQSAELTALIEQARVKNNKTNILNSFKFIKNPATAIHEN